ncbi:MAG: hypothetical protein K6G61_03450 [Solobacterium sp.]|nr:hypothetical protein [Solobacterium sp.]
MKKILTSVIAAAILLGIYSSFLFVKAESGFDAPVLKWEGKDIYYRSRWAKLAFTVTHAREKEYCVIRVYPEGKENNILFAKEITMTGVPGEEETVSIGWDAASNPAGKYIVDAHMAYESFSMRINDPEHIRIPVELVSYIWTHDEETDEWQYMDENGHYPDHEWVTIRDGLYYFEDNGILHHGWMELEDKTIYISINGMLKGWGKIDGKWYWFEEDGAMYKGWLNIDDNTYYLGEDGVMVTGKQTIDGKTYSFNDSGELLEK